MQPAVCGIFGSKKHWANSLSELRDWAQNFSSAQAQMKTDDTKEKEEEDGYAA